MKERKCLIGFEKVSEMGGNRDEVGASKDAVFKPKVADWCLASISCLFIFIFIFNFFIKNIISVFMDGRLFSKFF